MYINFAGITKIFLQIVRLAVATVRHRNTYLNEKRPPFSRRPFFAVENLFDKRDDKSGDDSFDFSGFVFRNKGGKTLTISHIFVFFPRMGNRHTVFKLAAIIIKRNVGEHKNQILSSCIGARCSLAAGKYINELSVHRAHYNATHPAKSSGTN